MRTQYANIIEHDAIIMEYLKSMHEKIKTNNKIPIEKLEKILRVSIKYAKATNHGLNLAQMWQKLKSIESLTKELSQQQNGINDKLTILKKKQTVTIATPKPQT